MQNVCKFVSPSAVAPTELYTVNFVRETTGNALRRAAIRSVYALYLVTAGKGLLVCDGRPYAIGKGDLFFLRPSCLYSIEDKGGLEFFYISFLGRGAARFLRRLDTAEPICRAPEGLDAFWRSALDAANPGNIDLISKSVLEYTAALLVADLPSTDGTTVVKELELCIRRDFADPDLSLRRLAKRFSYDEKYLSKLFFAQTGVRFGDYLTTLRINAACGLIGEGKTVVQEIARAVGYADPLYFSKVFRRKMHMTPTEYIRRERQDAPANKQGAGRVTGGFLRPRP